MEHLFKDKICRNFLKHYTEANYPHLLPKLVKLAILVLQNLYHKYYFTIEEIIEAIYYLSLEGQDLFLCLSNCNCKCNCNCDSCLHCQCKRQAPVNDLPSPLPENLPPYPIKRLKKSEIDYCCPPANTDDEIYVNVGNNFYDLNYYIPKTKSYRNKQLYSRRIVNPIFATRCRKIYPHWWWNMRCNESDNDTEDDHHPRSSKRYPKEIEDQIKKRYKSTHTIRKKTFDEDKIFPNTTSTDAYDPRYSPQRIEQPQVEPNPNSFYMTDQYFHSTHPTQFGNNPMDSSDGYQVSGSYSYIGVENPQLGQLGQLGGEGGRGGSREGGEGGAERRERVDRVIRSGGSLMGGDGGIGGDGGQGGSGIVMPSGSGSGQGGEGSSGGSRQGGSRTTQDGGRRRAYRITYDSDGQPVDVGRTDQDNKGQDGKPLYSIEGGRLIKKDGELRRRRKGQRQQQQQNP